MWDLCLKLQQWLYGKVHRTVHIQKLVRQVLVSQILVSLDYFAAIKEQWMDAVNKNLIHNIIKSLEACFPDGNQSSDQYGFIGTNYQNKKALEYISVSCVD